MVEPPKQEDNDVLVHLFVALPDGSDIRKDSHSVVPGTALKQILQDYKNSVSSAVGVEIKSIKLNSESDEGKSDNKLNYIMIPISFSVLVVLCLVACCLHCARYVWMLVMLCSFVFTTCRIASVQVFFLNVLVIFH